MSINENKPRGELHTFTSMLLGKKKKKKGLYIQYPKTVESFKLVVANFCRALSFFHSFMWTKLINNSAWSLIKDYVNHIKLTVIWVKRNQQKLGSHPKGSTVHSVPIQTMPSYNYIMYNVA